MIGSLPGGGPDKVLPARPAPARGPRGARIPPATSRSSPDGASLVTASRLAVPSITFAIERAGAVVPSLGPERSRTSAMRTEPAGHARVSRPCAVLFASLSLACVAPLAGAVDAAQCVAAFAPPPAPAVGVPHQDPDVIQVEADDALLLEEGVSTLSGDVHLSRGTTRIAAQEVLHEQRGEAITARGGVQIWDEDLFIRSERVQLDMADDRMVIDGARFILSEVPARGEAQRVEIDRKERARIDGARYTTCAPGDESWMLEAGDLDLDRGAGTGTARNVWIEFHGAPLLYTPYLRFPLSEERQSGLLAPSMRISGTRGLELSTPYYFNLAPNRDATLSARLMSGRGAQARGEYRYLMPWGEGRMSGELMPHDRDYGGGRSTFGFRHQGAFATRWSADVDYGWVSDKDYYRDLGTDLEHASRFSLRQRAEIGYSGSWFTLRGRVQDHQLLDDAIAAEELPYARLPQLLASTRLPERNRRINFAGRAEIARFDRAESVTGTRLDLRSSLRLPVRGAASFLIPEIALRYTGYALSDLAPGADRSPSRLLPSASLDAGLRLERDLQVGARSYVQTLEPRAYYLFVPPRSQHDLPVFDSGYRSFDFAQLFRENRFNGADRIGDANQLTLAVTSRLLSSAEGRELAAGSLGQVYHFRDREVTLPGFGREDDALSDLVAEGRLSAYHPWRLLAGVHWDPDEKRTSRFSTALRYQPDAGQVINVAYRFARADPHGGQGGGLEQADFSLSMPLRRNWRALGRWNYALRESRLVESFAGLEYGGCCWALRTLWRRYLNGDTGDYANAIFLHLELRGLGGAGSRPDSATLGIPGYRNPF